MKRIVHAITGLPTGGAQAMLGKLLARMDPTAWSPEVISLRDAGVEGARLAAHGVRVRTLDMRERPADLLALARLVGWLREIRPDVVQTWLYHADLFAGLAARAAGRRGLLWNLRQSNLDPAGDRRSTIWIARLCARLSRSIPVRIVCCSQASRRWHTAFGYDGSRMVVIPNGFDVSALRPDPAARAAVRREIAVGDDAPLIGLMARFDPQKDHRTFVAAANLLLATRPDVHFVLCGEGVNDANADLAAWIGDRPDRFHRLGSRDDVPRVTAALDVAALSSAYGEGFPNVLGEAMACGVPCVATDVGECAEIIAGTGRVVPKRDPAALAAAWRDLIDAGAEARRRLGDAARRRIAGEYELSTIVARYQDLYEEVAAGS